MDWNVIRGGIFGLVWVNIGPYLIWRYDRIVMPRFAFVVSRDLILDREFAERQVSKWHRFFSTKFLLIAVPWGIILTVSYVITLSAIEPQMGIKADITDFFFWAALIGMNWTAVLASMGFAGVIATVCFILTMSKVKIRIDPLHPDGLGGLGSVGDYAIATTMLFSTGALFLPLLFWIASYSGAAKIVLLGSGVLFIAFILLSFFVPTISIHYNAKKCRDLELWELNRQYRAAKEELACDRVRSIVRIKTTTEIIFIKDEYNSLKNMRLYPFETEMITKLVGSIILPLAFSALEYFSK